MIYSSAKMQKAGIFSLRQICRYIYTNNVKYNISKQSKIMKKIMNKYQSKRDSVACMIDATNVERGNTQLSIHTRRRMSVLNKVFMEYITDMLSTGEIEPEILNRNIEISHVNVTADFKLINIYWIDNSPQELNTGELLKNCAAELRHQLIQLRVIGMVPPVQFVKLKGINRIQEVEDKLNALDFGDNHVPNTYKNAPYHTVTAPASSTNDEGQNISEEAFSVSVPLMKHDVFGLDHYRIMSKIKISLNQARNVQKNLTTNATRDITPGLQSATNLLTETEQKEQFSKFLRERQKEAKRKLKKRLSDNNLVNYLEESIYENDDYNIENDYNDFDNVEEDAYSDDEYK